ncbi:MAG: hypothetical protein PWP08_1720 [Methanofollis sp.]|nr:hypothetical protein [Methanofollis sp.]
MDIARVLRGTGDPLEIYTPIAGAIAEISTFPDLVESIYDTANGLSDDEADRLHFGLIRLQIYADVHRYENMELLQQMKYVAQVLEKLIFGSLMLEGGEPGAAERE